MVLRNQLQPTAKELIIGRLIPVLFIEDAQIADVFGHG